MKVKVEDADWPMASLCEATLSQKRSGMARIVSDGIKDHTVLPTIHTFVREWSEMW